MTRHLSPVHATPEFDPYGLEDSGHNPNGFYTFCGKESTSITIRIPTVYINLVGAQIATREIPDYQTPADFYRDAIHHRIYWLTHHYRKPQMEDQMNVFTQMERSKERLKALQARRDIIPQFREEFETALTSQSPGACRQVIEEVKAAIDTRDAEDDTYKTDLLELLKMMERKVTVFG